MKTMLIDSNLLVVLLLFGCNATEQKIITDVQPMPFDTNSIAIKTSNYKDVKGQLLYLPVYSSIPYNIDTVKYLTNMSAFVAIHNTDLQNKIKITQVLYFNTDGKLVDDFLKGKVKILEPLAAVDFYVPFEDKSGTGANFLIEWQADSAVNEPLIESITMNLTNNQSGVILSQGKIIREIR